MKGPGGRLHAGKATSLGRGFFTVFWIDPAGKSEDLFLTSSHHLDPENRHVPVSNRGSLVKALGVESLHSSIQYLSYLSG